MILPSLGPLGLKELSRIGKVLPAPREPLDCNCRGTEHCIPDKTSPETGSGLLLDFRGYPQRQAKSRNAWKAGYCQ